MKTILHVLENLTLSQALVYGLLLALVIELITAGLRFGLDLQATRDTATLGKYTFGFRIHHGYIGLLLVIISLLPDHTGISRLLLIVGIGLLVSDLVHHFLVLWPITGSHDFHIRYPD
jgi:hypothetical protein